MPPDLPDYPAKEMGERLRSSRSPRRKLLLRISVLGFVLSAGLFGIGAYLGKPNPVFIVGVALFIVTFILLALLGERMVCPRCDEQTIYSAKSEGNGWDVLECQKCRGKWRIPSPQP
jgi:hypothetical protein